MSPADRQFRLTVALFGCRCQVTLVVPPWLQWWAPRAALVVTQLAIAAGFITIGTQYDDSANTSSTNHPMPWPRGPNFKDPITYDSNVEYGWPVSWKGERRTWNQSQSLFTQSFVGWNPAVVASAGLALIRPWRRGGSRSASDGAAATTPPPV
jgi:hypothetical protein